ncbi:MAG: hypothetical protein EBX61_07385 [Betaproteobacteria bacterium]|nr:hypothetical protein [Betaproteobacteria bacterium]
MNVFSNPHTAPMPLSEIPFPARQGSSALFASSSSALQVDIAVIGASVACLFTAQALAKLGYRCALIGPEPVYARHQVGFDQRIFALSPASWAWMQDQGLSAAIQSQRLGLINRMHIHAPPLGSVEPIVFDAYRAALEQLALTVEQSELIAAGQQAVAMAGVLRLQESLVGIDPPVLGARAASGLQSALQAGQTRRITLEHGKTLEARLLVGCDGAHSGLRKLAGITSRRFDYKASAVVANFACGSQHRHSAYQWFTDQGILALLPLPGQALSMVWSAPQPIADRLMSLGGESLRRHVQAFLESLGSDAPVLVSCLNQPASFPLIESLSDSPTAQRLLLLADAAHVVHPMAGQGLNLGIGDMIELTDVLSRPASRHDPGQAPCLERYVRRRAEPVAALSLLTRRLYQWFEQRPTPLLAAIGAWGWSRVAGSSLIQSALIRQAVRHGPN